MARRKLKLKEDEDGVPAKGKGRGRGRGKGRGRGRGQKDQPLKAEHGQGDSKCEIAKELLPEFESVADEEPEPPTPLPKDPPSKKRPSTEKLDLPAEKQRRRKQGQAVEGAKPSKRKAPEESHPGAKAKCSRKQDESLKNLTTAHEAGNVF